MTINSYEYDAAYAALCMWEEMTNPSLAGAPEPWVEMRERIGMAELRGKVLNLGAACDAAWTRTYANHEVAYCIWCQRRQQPGGQVVGDYKEYRVYPRELDVLPLDTFLIESEVGTGGYPRNVGRIVKPNHPKNYDPAGLTPEKRMVYKFWQDGHAVKMIALLTKNGASSGGLIYRYIIMPGMAGYDDLVGFKTLCDVRRSWSDGKVKVSTALLCRAIGWPKVGLT